MATLTGAGFAKLEAAAPGHVMKVRQLLIDVLTDGRLETLREIGTRAVEQTDPDARCLRDDASP